RLTGEELSRMAQQYLESLRAAGVEWLPSAPLPPMPPPAVSAEARPEQVQAPFFEGLSATTVEPESQGAGRTLEERRQALRMLAVTVAGCPRCPELVATRRQTVFGVGEPGVELCFVGEAPGADEDAQGEPFVGAAGQLLNRIIAACRMKREDVYICNIIKCRPPGNRLPLPNEVANCREYLERQLELIRPKFICAMGAC